MRLERGKGGGKGSRVSTPTATNGILSRKEALLWFTRPFVGWQAKKVLDNGPLDHVEFGRKTSLLGKMAVTLAPLTGNLATRDPHNPTTNKGVSGSLPLAFQDEDPF
jgi:hypothetical protein